MEHTAVLFSGRAEKRFPSELRRKRKQRKKPRNYPFSFESCCSISRCDGLQKTRPDKLAEIAPGGEKV